jgi:glycosyltransferase involved in cell wall biosynthesis
MKKYVVYVDSACDILYSSYYIHGLMKIFGKVKFSNKYFSDFKHNNKYFPVVIKDGNKLHKLIFDYGDGYRIDEQALAWCDAYGKININDTKEEELSKSPKLVSMGPGFGIYLYPKSKTIIASLANYIKSYKRITNKRRFFADYFAQNKRQSLDYYSNVESKGNYAFFAGALWKKELETNKLRANFIRACKRVEGLNFEGGFAPRSNNDVIGYEDITLERQVPISDYLSKIKESAVVFNTPVILDCHGWKLGEFMAMGKAIIATPLINKLPANMEHGKHVHFVDGSEDSIYDAVKLLTSNQQYRQQMEANIHKYFVDHVSPEVSVRKVLEKVGL